MYSFQDALNALESNGCKPTKSGNGYVAFCPAHEADGQGHKPSLSVAPGDQQPVVFTCHAGCTFPEIAKALGLSTARAKSNIVAEYDYRDATGRLVFQKIRLEPKDFRIRHLPPQGDWVWKKPKLDTYPLYRLPELCAAIVKGEIVWICEGEKDANRLAGMGFVATCNFEGAAKPTQKPKWRPEYTRQLQGAARVILLPDNDEPGKAHMRHIAQQLHGKVADLRWLELPGLPEKGDVSDWLNEGHTIDELQVLAEVAPDVPALLRRDDSKQKGGTSYFEGYKGYNATDLNEKENSCSPLENGKATRLQTPRPYYFMIHLDGRKEGGINLEIEDVTDDNEPRSPGLWFVGAGQVPTPDGGTELRYFEPAWISIPFETLATADDGRGYGYCIAVRFKALHGQTHTWPIPRALLVTDGREILNRLYEMGFKAMDKPAKANDHLRSYLNRARPDRQALSVSKTGWAGTRFVLPDRVFGENAEDVFYQSDDPKASPYTLAGSLSGWRERVAQVVAPYDLPVFAISCSFAAPLLSLLGIPSGGFHFMGSSTTGKTTAQNWGLSVWGKPKDLRHNWHGTKVGFELTAAAHSDAVLMLDEIGQADPREVGDLIYMIFNEAGRMRGNARLTHRALPRWQLLLLSSGEKSLQHLMQDVGKTPMAGQELRLLHIPAHGGDGCGILNGLTDSNARTELIRQVDAAASKHHGHPIQAFLTRLTHPDHLAKSADAAVQVKAMALRLTEGIESDEVKRAALRFALVGFAGELASEWEITGWPPGHAFHAAQVLFNRWLSAWGTAARHDETTFLEHLEVWLSGNSTGHFAEVDPVTLDITATAERALTSLRPFYGYTADADTGRTFYLNAAGWQALTKGFARSLVIETLTAAGRLEKDANSNKGKQIRVGDRSRGGQRFYVIRETANVE